MEKCYCDLELTEGNLYKLNKELQFWCCNICSFTKTIGKKTFLYNFKFCKYCKDKHIKTCKLF